MTEAGRARTPHGPPTGFRLATPGNWFDLDLDPATRTGSIAALVDDRIAASPDLRSRREELVQMLLEAAREAAEHGVAFSSMLAEAVDGRGMAASLNLAVRAATLTAGGGTPVTDPEAILASLGAETADGGARPRGAAAVIDLPAGRAVRTCELRDNPLPGTDRSVVTLVVQYLVPVPATPALAMLTFSTPTVGLEEIFTELFDVIAESFEFEWDGGGEGM